MGIIFNNIKIMLVINIKNILLNWLFPIHCICCGQEDAWLCHKCQGHIPPPKTPPFVPVGLNRIICATTFASPVKELIHYYKYDHAYTVAPIMADLIMRQLQNYPVATNPIIIPVPLHKRRQRERGFNQAELIAKQIHKKLNWTIMTGVLIRKRHTSQQAKLNKTQRLSNLTNAFCITKYELIVDRDIILLDDVLTTGATLTACAAALQTAKPRSITGLCVAYDELT